MKKLLIIWIFLLIPAQLFAENGDYEVAFSPRGGGTELIVKAISEARQSIKVAAYSFTSKPIAQALVDAHKKGIEIEVVLDKSQNSERYTSATFLANMGVPVRIDSHYAIMHNKFMVIDEKSVQLGSFNYTKAAEEKNAENVLVIRNNPQLATIYNKNWKKLWDESEEYQKRY
jgi:phosphatidylserine/phosphatidylglycerophosphate/cardiolipin synthase-like enzyme